MMKNVPIILQSVIVSEKQKYENTRIKTIVMLLQRKALPKSMNSNIFCHKTAYTAKAATTPKRQQIYGKERNSCCDANLLHIVELE